jgi:hypothetical protein
MLPEIEQIVDSRMNIQKTLGLFNRLELAHTPLSHPGWLMR